MIVSEEHGMEILTLFGWWLTNVNDLAQQFYKFNTGSAEWAFVFVSAATVLVYNLRMISLEEGEMH